MAIGGLVVAVAVLVGAVFLGIQFAKPDETDRTGASAVVSRYLDSLAAGDAETALGLGYQQSGGSRKLLTSDVLRGQIERMPITDIDVDEAAFEGPYGKTYVKASAKFGGVRSEADIPMREVDGTWKLETAFVDADSHSGSNDQSIFAVLRVLGEPASSTGKFQAFPGFIDVQALTPNVAVTEQPTFLLNGLTASSVTYTPKVALTDVGRRAVNDAVAAYVAKWYNDPYRSGFDYGIRNLIPTSVQTTGPATVVWSKTTFPLEISYVVNIIARGSVPVTATTRSGGTYRGPLELDVGGVVDMSKNPPVFQGS